MPDTAKPDTAVDALVSRFFTDYPKIAAQNLEQLPPADASEILCELPADKMIDAWEALNPSTGAEILMHMSADAQTLLARSADTGKLAVLLSRMDEAARTNFFANIGENDASELKGLLSYPPDTAGQLMDTRIVALRGSSTVAQATETLRRLHRGKDIGELKIVDDENKLNAIVDIEDFALAEPDQTLDELAHGVIAVVFAMDPREEIVDKLERYSLEELPVIGPDGVLLGVIRHSRLIDALRETASVDIQTMVGASKDERATSSSWFALRRRMPWLQINLLTAFLAAAVVGLFEGTIAKFTALAVLLPVVAGQSGNAGAQALAVTMRGLALREIRLDQWLKVTLKEINTGFWNGIAIAITCGVGVYIWSGKIGLVLVIASSMIFAMVAAGIAGALVPITLKRLGQDPAVASSIILTTVTDVAGFFSFLGIATLLAGMLA